MPGAVESLKVFLKKFPIVVNLLRITNSPLIEIYVILYVKYGEYQAQKKVRTFWQKVLDKKFEGGGRIGVGIYQNLKR